VPRSGPGIPIYEARPESALKEEVLVPQMRHRAQVNAAAGILVEAYDQVSGITLLEQLLDTPRGALRDDINALLSAFEGLMIKVGRLLTQTGDSIQVGERMDERWISPKESAAGALVVVNGSKG
jgi:hypothetical protein